jgi:hypothetical protein
MIYQYDDFNYFLVIDKDFTKNIFIKKMKVKPDSYAEKIVCRIYDYLTVNAVDVVEEYKNYYAKEYRNLNEFLYKKYNIESTLIRTLIKVLTEDNKLYHCNKYGTGDNSICELVFSDSMLSTLNKIVK